MQWTPEEFASLLHFLGNVTSPDQAVQSENILQLRRLEDWAAAPYALLDVMCHSHYAPPIRQAAVLVLKQLVRMNPRIIEGIHTEAVELPLLEALVDPLPSVRVGASLVMASILNGVGLFGKQPTLLFALQQRSSQIRMKCQEENTPDGISCILKVLLGLATCVRILCEDCGDSFSELVKENGEICDCLTDILRNLLQSASILLLHCGESAIPVVTAVLGVVTSCFMEEVFHMDECVSSSSTITLSDDSAAISENGEVHHPAVHETFKHATMLHDTSCLLIVQASKWLTDTELLQAVMHYMNTILQWATLGSEVTLHAASAVLPQLFFSVNNSDSAEVVVVLCLEFIASLAESEVGGATLLSNAAGEVATVLFRSGVLSSNGDDSPDLEQTAHLPDDETTVRPIVFSHQTRLLEDEGSDNDNDNNNDFGLGDDNNENGASIRQALAHTLNVICCTNCTNLLGHLIPLLAAVLSPESHSDTVSPKMVEAALFIFAELVDELFETLDAAFMARVAHNCLAALTPTDSSTHTSVSPYLLRYQALRCVTRMVNRYVEVAENMSLVIQELISPLSVLKLLISVVIHDASKHVQVEAIQSIAFITLALVVQCRKQSTTDAACNISDVFQELLNIFPALRLGARTMVYSSISRVFPLALCDPSVLDEVIVLRTISLLGYHGHQLACSLLSNASTIVSSSAAMEFISVLNALVDVVSNAGSNILLQTIEPLVELTIMVVNGCNNDTSSSPLGAYSSDVTTLGFDMLDGCCDALLNEQETLCGTDESSISKKEVLRRVMILGCMENVHTNVVGLCLQMMEMSPTAMEIRRSCLSFLCNVVRFCADPAVISRICRLCIQELNRTTPGKKIISNAFLCFGRIFYHFLFNEPSGMITALTHIPLSDEEVNMLTAKVGKCLSTTSFEGDIAMKINAFNCALALAAFYPTAFSQLRAKEEVEEEILPYRWFLNNAAILLPQMRSDVGDQFRALTTLALLLSRDKDQQLRSRKQKESLLSLPSMAIIIQAVQAFMASVHAVLAAEVWKCWVPWIHPNSC